MFEFPEDAYVSHAAPGRLRVRVPSKKKDALFFSGIQAELSGLQGVNQVSVNPMTGSILVLHTVDQETLAEFLKIANLGSPASAGSYSEVIKTFNMVDHRVKGFVGGGVNVAILASFSLLLAGTYQLARGNYAAIPWYTAFWYGLNIFLKAKPAGNGGAE